MKAYSEVNLGSDQGNEELAMLVEGYNMMSAYMENIFTKRLLSSRHVFAKVVSVDADEVSVVVEGVGRDIEILGERCVVRCEDALFFRVGHGTTCWAYPQLSGLKVGDQVEIFIHRTDLKACRNGSVAAQIIHLPRH